MPEEMPDKTRQLFLIFRDAVQREREAQVTSCLSGCFSKPQLVVYGHAAPSVSENLARVSVDVRYRRGLPEV
ncbi:MAG: hypothetical protein ABSA41_23110, partial [Terriglobia bacterium]